MEEANINSISKNQLSREQRQAVLEFLLQRTEEGKIKKGSITEAASIFLCSKKTVSRLWKQAKQNLDLNNGCTDIYCKQVGRVGRKRIEINPIDVVNIPLRRRTNIRSLSKELNMARSTVHRRIKDGILRCHSNATKPSLTEENMKKRLMFCLSMLDVRNLNGDNIPFANMNNYIHVDEKWFFMSRKAQKYYLLPTEQEPYRTCKSTKFITKVMFLAAVTRPRFDCHGNTIFSGKIGIFPFTEKVSAKRTSKNRIAGTLVTKPMNSVTKEVYRAYLLEKVLPAIEAKWPSNGGSATTIYIQQDNAKPHIDPSDIEFNEAISRSSLDIQLCFQPPNSPDFNVLDLGFFNAIQSLQHQEAPSTIDELVSAVEKSYESLTPQCLDKVFVTLQSCMLEAMKIHGGNRYMVPHIGKDQFGRDGVFPSVMCDKLLVEEIQSHLYG